MKNIIILIIVAIAISFSSAIAAEKLDISEEAVKGFIIREKTEEYVKKWNVSIEEICNAKIVAHSQRSMKLGVMNFYVVAADIKAVGINHYDKGLFLIYTIHNSDAEMIVVYDPIILSPEYVVEYQNSLAKFKESVKQHKDHQKIALSFAVQTM